MVFCALDREECEARVKAKNIVNQDQLSWDQWNKIALYIRYTGSTDTSPSWVSLVSNTTQVLQNYAAISDDNIIIIVLTQLLICGFHGRKYVIIKNIQLLRICGSDVKRTATSLSWNGEKIERQQAYV